MISDKVSASYFIPIMLRRILFFILALSNVNLNGQGPIFQLAPLSDQHSNVIASAPAPDCSDGEVHDDGSYEVGYTMMATTGSDNRFVERFTPPVYPYDYLQFCVAFSSRFAIDFNFELVVFDDDGLGNAPGTLLAAIPAFASLAGNINTTFSFDVTGKVPAITSGNVYIGIRFAPVNALFLADATPETTLQIAYFYTNDPGHPSPETYLSLSSSSRALSVRASGQLHSSGAASVPTLSQWSVLILSLVLGIMGVVKLRQRNVVA